MAEPFEHWFPLLQHVRERPLPVVGVYSSASAFQELSEGRTKLQSASLLHCDPSVPITFRARAPAYIVQAVQQILQAAGNRPVRIIAVVDSMDSAHSLRAALTAGDPARDPPVGFYVAHAAVPSPAAASNRGEILSRASDAAGDVAESLLTARRAALRAVAPLMVVASRRFKVGWLSDIAREASAVTHYRAAYDATCQAATEALQKAPSHAALLLEALGRRGAVEDGVGAVGVGGPTVGVTPLGGREGGLRGRGVGLLDGGGGLAPQSLSFEPSGGSAGTPPAGVHPSASASVPEGAAAAAAAARHSASTPFGPVSSAGAASLGGGGVADESPFLVAARAAVAGSFVLSALIPSLLAVEGVAAVSGGSIAALVTQHVKWLGSLATQLSTAWPSVVVRSVGGSLSGPPNSFLQHAAPPRGGGGGLPGQSPPRLNSSGAGAGESLKSTGSGSGARAHSPQARSPEGFTAIGTASRTTVSHSAARAGASPLARPAGYGVPAVHPLFPWRCIQPGPIPQAAIDEGVASTVATAVLTHPVAEQTAALAACIAQHACDVVTQAASLFEDVGASAQDPRPQAAAAAARASLSFAAAECGTVAAVVAARHRLVVAAVLAQSEDATAVCEALEPRIFDLAALPSASIAPVQEGGSSGGRPLMCENSTVGYVALTPTTLDAAAADPLRPTSLAVPAGAAYVVAVKRLLALATPSAIRNRWHTAAAAHVSAPVPQPRVARWCAVEAALADAADGSAAARPFLAAALAAYVSDGAAAIAVRLQRVLMALATRSDDIVMYTHVALGMLGNSAAAANMRARTRGGATRESFDSAIAVAGWITKLIGSSKTTLPKAQGRDGTSAGAIATRWRGSAAPPEGEAGGGGGDSDTGSSLSAATADDDDLSDADYDSGCAVWFEDRTLVEAMSPARRPARPPRFFSTQLRAFEEGGGDVAVGVVHATPHVAADGAISHTSTAGSVSASTSPAGPADTLCPAECKLHPTALLRHVHVFIPVGLAGVSGAAAPRSAPFLASTSVADIVAKGATSFAHPGSTLASQSSAVVAALAGSSALPPVGIHTSLSPHVLRAGRSALLVVTLESALLAPLCLAGVEVTLSDGSAVVLTAQHIGCETVPFSTTTHANARTGLELSTGAPAGGANEGAAGSALQASSLMAAPLDAPAQRRGRSSSSASSCSSSSSVLSCSDAGADEGRDSKNVAVAAAVIGSVVGAQPAPPQAATSSVPGDVSDSLVIALPPAAVDSRGRLIPSRVVLMRRIAVHGTAISTPTDATSPSSIQLAAEAAEEGAVVLEVTRVVACTTGPLVVGLVSLPAAGPDSKLLQRHLRASLSHAASVAGSACPVALAVCPPARALLSRGRGPRRTSLEGTAGAAPIASPGSGPSFVSTVPSLPAPHGFSFAAAMTAGVVEGVPSRSKVRSVCTASSVGGLCSLPSVAGGLPTAHHPVLLVLPRAPRLRVAVGIAGQRTPASSSAAGEGAVRTETSSHVVGTGQPVPLTVTLTSDVREKIQDGAVKVTVEIHTDRPSGDVGGLVVPQVVLCERKADAADRIMDIALESVALAQQRVVESSATRADPSERTVSAGTPTTPAVEPVAPFSTAITAVPHTSSRHTVDVVVPHASASSSEKASAEVTLWFALSCAARASVSVVAAYNVVQQSAADSALQRHAPMPASRRAVVHSMASVEAVAPITMSCSLQPAIPVLYTDAKVATRIPTIPSSSPWPLTRECIASSIHPTVTLDAPLVPQWHTAAAIAQVSNAPPTAPADQSRDGDAAPVPPMTAKADSTHAPGSDVGTSPTPTSVPTDTPLILTLTASTRQGLNANVAVVGASYVPLGAPVGRSAVLRSFTSWATCRTLPSAHVGEAEGLKGVAQAEESVGDGVLLRRGESAVSVGVIAAVSNQGTLGSAAQPPLSPIGLVVMHVGVVADDGSFEDAHLVPHVFVVPEVKVYVPPVLPLYIIPRNLTQWAPGGFALVLRSLSRRQNYVSVEVSDPVGGDVVWSGRASVTALPLPPLRTVTLPWMVIPQAARRVAMPSLAVSLRSISGEMLTILKPTDVVACEVKSCMPCKGIKAFMAPTTALVSAPAAPTATAAVGGAAAAPAAGAPHGLPAGAAGVGGGSAEMVVAPAAMSPTEASESRAMPPPRATVTQDDSDGSGSDGLLAVENSGEDESSRRGSGVMVPGGDVDAPSGTADALPHPPSAPFGGPSGHHHLDGGMDPLALPPHAPPTPSLPLAAGLGDGGVGSSAQGTLPGPPPPGPPPPPPPGTIAPPAGAADVTPSATAPPPQAVSAPPPPGPPPFQPPPPLAPPPLAAPPPLPPANPSDPFADVGANAEDEP